MLLKPPSTFIIWPVTHEAFSDKRKTVASAMSLGMPTLFNGFLSEWYCSFSGVLRSLSARPVLVRAGAIALTRIEGENSAAKARVNPSIPPFEIAT